MTRAVALLSIVFCAGVLAYTLIANDLLIQGIVVILLGAIWVVLNVRGITRFTGLAFFIFGMIAVFAIWADISRWFALTCMILALFAWDLTAFAERLKGVTNHDDARQMEHAHFARIALLIGLVVVGVIAASLIKIDLTLGSALILTLIGIWGISTLVYRLRSRE